MNPCQLKTNIDNRKVIDFGRGVLLWLLLHESRLFVEVIQPVRREGMKSRTEFPTDLVSNLFEWLHGQRRILPIKTNRLKNTTSSHSSIPWAFEYFPRIGVVCICHSTSDQIVLRVLYFYCIKETTSSKTRRNWWLFRRRILGIGDTSTKLGYICVGMNHSKSHDLFDSWWETDFERLARSSEEVSKSPC